MLAARAVGFPRQTRTAVALLHLTNPLIKMHNREPYPAVTNWHGRCSIYLYTLAKRSESINAVTRDRGTEMNMNILYNSNHYFVLEYLAGNGYEVVDKYLGRGTFLAGEVASRFCKSIIGAIEEDPSFEHVDEFLHDFGGPIDYRATLH